MTDADPPLQDNQPSRTEPAKPRTGAAIVQAAAGAFLLLLMGIVTVNMAPSLLAAPEALPDGSRFNASQETARLVLGLFGSVMLFGAISLAVGLRQAMTGVRPRGLSYLLWASGALILVLVLLVVFAIKQGQA